MATIRKRGDKYQVQVRREGCKGISKTFYQLKDAQAWARRRNGLVLLISLLTMAV